MFSPTQMGQIYLIFNQLPFLWDTSETRYEQTDFNDGGRDDDECGDSGDGSRGSHAGG